MTSITKYSTLELSIQYCTISKTWRSASVKRVQGSVCKVPRALGGLGGEEEVGMETKAVTESESQGWVPPGPALGIGDPGDRLGRQMCWGRHLN